MESGFSKHPMSQRNQPFDTGITDNPVARVRISVEEASSLKYGALLLSSEFQAELQKLNAAAQAIIESTGAPSLPDGILGATSQLGPVQLHVQSAYEWRVVNLFLNWLGGLLLFFGSMLFVVLIALWLFGPRRNEEDDRFLLLAGLVYAFGFQGAGVWYSFFRKPPTGSVVWVCRNGLVIKTANLHRMFFWGEGVAIYRRRCSGCLELGVRVSFPPVWFRLADTPANRHLLKSIEIRASATILTDVTLKLAGGIPFDFDSHMVTPTMLISRWNALMVEWADIREIEEADDKITIRKVNGDEMPLSMSELAFPSLVLTLATGLMTYWKSQSSLPGESVTSSIIKVNRS